MTLKYTLYYIIVILLICIIIALHAPPQWISLFPSFKLISPNTLRNSHVFLDSTRLSSAPQPPSTKTRYAIFASSIHSQHRSYIFYAPIAAAAWQRIGYNVIVIFVGDFTLTPATHAATQLSITRAFLQQLGVQIVHFQCPPAYSIKLSQIVRIFAGFLPDSIVADDDFIITTDSDIIPMQQSDYEIQSKTDGFIYNAFCCGKIQRKDKSYPMYPMSHICLKKKVWRELFLESIQRQELLKSSSITPNLTLLLAEKAPLSFDLVSVYIRHEFRDLYDSNMVKGDSAWYMDQVFISMLLNDYTERHANFQLNKRHKTSKRLDPNIPIYTWTSQRMKDYGDAHIIHDEIFDAHRWNPFKHLLNYLFNSSLVKDFELYYQKFTLTRVGQSTDY